MAAGRITPARRQAMLAAGVSSESDGEDEDGGYEEGGYYEDEGGYRGRSKEKRRRASRHAKRWHVFSHRGRGGFFYMPASRVKVKLLRSVVKLSR